MTLFEKISWHIKFRYNKIREKIIIPPYTEKRSIILGYKEKYNTHVFVETGTFLGDTIALFKNQFKKLISFELSEELAAKAAARFSEEKHITIVNGDSGKLLASCLEKIDEPCLFWLDGHYSSEFFMGSEYIVTAKGEKETPILEELKAILNHPVKQHVILIDDARCFTGGGDYPALTELKSFVHGFRKDVDIVVKRDIIRITPSA